MYKIGIIEDDQKIRNELAIFLNKYGYDTKIFINFQNIIDDVLKSNVHLIILDINLPLYDGYYICKQIRKKSNVPIIVVTSRNSELDELMSLNLGADDYIAKPYNTQIILSRIASILKRTYNTENSKIVSYKDLILNISNSTIEYKAKNIELTKNETKILYMFMSKPQNIITRDEIMNELWQSNEFVDDNTLTVNINRLRKKLEEVGLKDFLITKRGQGYII